MAVKSSKKKKKHRENNGCSLMSRRLSGIQTTNLKSVFQEEENSLISMSSQLIISTSIFIRSVRSNNI